MSTTPSDFEALQAMADQDAKASQDSARPRAAARGRSGGASSPSSGPTSAGRSTRTAPLERRLQQMFTQVAVITSFVLDPYCGTILQERSAALASAWNDLAQQDPRVKKALEAMLSGGNYGQAIVVTAMTVLPILRHHGLIPESLSGLIGSVVRGEEDGEGDEAPEAVGPPTMAPSSGVGEA